ncbi:hypothetical protein MtrunA17_Chr8g0338921 [Medicago truncatula]|uniref:Uncharacterized protein n=1 Tax=Medicago truncatula TaxID=3880 RepID=A0A396GEM4_MEDTR|nr:hypothetical protein MtrunA17_Chr8g0338921 [Medicago truncatula]
MSSQTLFKPLSLCWFKHKHVPILFANPVKILLLDFGCGSITMIGDDHTFTSCDGRLVLTSVDDSTFTLDEGCMSTSGDSCAFTSANGSISMLVDESTSTVIDASTSTLGDSCKFTSGDGGMLTSAHGSNFMLVDGSTSIINDCSNSLVVDWP